MAKKARLRGFEIVSFYQDQYLINIPTRKTAGSAGYDLEAVKDVIVGAKETVFVPTGLKAYMQKDEYLGIYIRSSIAIKRGLMLVNGTGIIDSDYYNNADNEGEIFVVFYNTKPYPVVIKSGERVAQGIFEKFLTADDDNADAKRTGGMGSTGE